MRQPRTEQEPTFKVREAARFTMIEPEVATEVVDEPGYPLSTPGHGWRTVDSDTPRDGTVIQYKTDPDQADTETKTARWRITRVRRGMLVGAGPEVHELDDNNGQRWVRIGYWADPLTNMVCVPAPMVWRMMDGFEWPAVG